MSCSFKPGKGKSDAQPCVSKEENIEFDLNTFTFQLGKIDEKKMCQDSSIKYYTFSLFENMMKN